MENVGSILCQYGDFGQYLSMAHKSSLFMGWILFSVSLIYKDVTLWILTKSLLILQFLVWTGQLLFQDLRYDPWCRNQIVYAFPNMEIIYTWALGFVFILHNWVWKFKISYFRWFILSVWMIGPVSIIVITDHLIWWEILISITLGIFYSIVYIFVFKNHICPLLPYILTTWPVKWLGIKDLGECLNKYQRRKLHNLERVKKKWLGVQSFR